MAEGQDLLLVNGTFRTFDPGLPVAAAVGIRDGRIAAVGSEEACRARLQDPKVLDLGGAWVVPGLIDAHAHVLGLGAYLTEVDLVGARSEEEAVARVAAKIAEGTSGEDEWIRGFGWNQSLWPTLRFPTHHLLSQVVQNRPVWLKRIDAHAGWANAKALELAGIGPSTPDPPGGLIVRDEAGRPTGVLIDGAMAAVESILPPPSEEERERLLLLALETCASYGLTAVHDAGMDGPTLELAMRLDREGRLPIRLYAMIDGTRPGLLEHWLERGPWLGERLAIRCVKFFLDGALGSRGAAFFDDYSDDPGNRGLTLLEPSRYEELLRIVTARGFQAAVHAIGDRANAQALDGFAAAGVPPSARPRLEHAQIMRPLDFPRVAELGVVASMQPSHCVGDMPFVEARIGRGRLRGAFAWRSLVEAGALLAFGSDFPIESPDPIGGLHAAITRCHPSGSPCFEPSERIELETALEAFTSGAAWAAFADHEQGRIRPGHWADLTFFDRDLLATGPQGLLEARVLGTVVDGRLAWKRPGSAVEAAFVAVAE